MTEHLNLPARAELLMKQKYGKQPGGLDSVRVPTVPVKDKGQPLGEKEKKLSQTQKPPPTNQNLSSAAAGNKNTVARGR